MTEKSVSRVMRQRRRWLAGVLTLVAVGLFVAAAASAPNTKSASSQYDRVLPLPEQSTRTASSASPNALSARGQKSIPVRINIPAIGVSAKVIPLGLNRNRTIQVPKNFAQTGWFKPGPEPGERGAAVIVGHVDSKRGPAVFYRLRALRRGDVIRITLKNHQRVQYVVSGTRAVPKKRFPTKLVYKQTAEPTLRMITCDGAFDSSTGHYVGNYIVLAKLRK